MMSSQAGAESALERLSTAWSNVHDYTVTIDAHEVLGSRSQDRELHYAFRAPMQARLDLMSGEKSVATIVWSGDDNVVAYRPGLSFLKIHGHARDRRLTSLRGNGVLTPDLGHIIACFAQHKDAIDQRRGPAVDGEPTDEIALVGTHSPCPDDPPADQGVTLDAIDVSRRGVIVMRKRYEGAQLVEAWSLKDYRINAGLDDSIFK